MARWDEYNSKELPVNDTDELLINSGGIIKRLKAIFFKGNKGDTGNGIDNITTSKTNKTTTITIKETDGSETLFNILDGLDGNGIGDMVGTNNLSELTDTSAARDNLGIDKDMDIDGYGLSANDFTDELLEKLNGLNKDEYAKLSGGNEFNGEQIFNDGNVGIGTNNPQAKLDVNGTIHTDSIYTTYWKNVDLVLNKKGDGTIANSNRQSGRALVAGGGELVVNFGGDFSNTLIGNPRSNNSQETVGNALVRYDTFNNGIIYDRVEDIRGQNLLPNNGKFKRQHIHHGFVEANVVGIPNRKETWAYVKTINKWDSSSQTHRLTQIATNSDNLWIRNSTSSTTWGQWKNLSSGGYPKLVYQSPEWYNNSTSNRWFEHGLDISSEEEILKYRVKLRIRSIESGSGSKVQYINVPIFWSGTPQDDLFSINSTHIGTRVNSLDNNFGLNYCSVFIYKEIE